MDITKKIDNGLSKNRKNYYINRQEVDKLLLDDWQVFLITSPAGYGKTFLLESIKTKKDNNYYIQLKPNSNFIEDFISDILNHLEENFLSKFKSDIKNNKKKSTSLLTEITSDLINNLVFIIDDFQDIESKEINEYIYLLTKNSEKIKFIISSRVEPKFIFKDKMILENKFFRCSLENLVLDDNQVKNLFISKRIIFDDSEIKLIQNYFEGWIAGISIFVNNFKYKKNQFINFSDFKNLKNIIFEYIENEVFNQLNYKEKELIFSLAILDNFSNDMISYLDKKNDFDKIVDKNIFLVKKDNNYQFTRIFREFVLEKSNLSKEVKNDIYIKVADFLKGLSSHDISLVINYYIKSENKEKIFNLIDDYAKKSFEYGNLSLITDLISDLPLDYFERSFNILLVYSWGLIKKGSIDLAASIIAKLKPLVKSIDDDCEYRLIKANYLYKISKINEYDDLINQIKLVNNNYFLLSRIYLDLGWISLFNGLYSQSDEYFIQSVRNSYLSKENLYTVAGYLGRSQCLSIRGEFFQAEKLLQVCIEKTSEKYYEKEELDLIAYLSLTPIYSEWDIFDKVKFSLEKSFEILKKYKYSLYINYLILSVNVYISFKDLKNARKYMIYLEENIMSNKSIPDSFLRIYSALEAYFNLASGNYYLSEKWLNTKIIEFKSNNSMENLEDIEWTTFLDFLINTDNKLANEVCDSYLLQAKQINSKRKIIRLLVFRACIKIKKGKWQLAYKDIEDALIIGEPDNYIRSFSNYSNYILPIIEDINNKVLESEINYVSEKYINKIVISSRVNSKDSIEIRNYELTLREKDVLNLITEKMTNENIGYKLFISTETVKVHVRNILKKLNATSRQEAIIKAKKEKII